MYKKKETNFERNSCIYIIKNIMGVLFPLITFKYASKIILPEGIGKVNYVQAIVSYFSLIASMGISSFAIAEGSKIREDKEKFARFASTLFTLNIISTIIAYLLLFATLILAADLRKYRDLILIYSLIIIFSTLGVEWVFNVYEKFSYITIRSIVFQFLSLVLLFIIVRNRNDVIWYVILLVFSSTGSNLLNFMYVKKIVKLRLVKIKYTKEYILPVIRIWIANAASLIYVNADTIIIGFLLGDIQVGYYSAAVKIIKAICVPITAVCTVAGPSLAIYINQSNKVETSKMINRTLNTMSFFIFPIMIGLCCFSSEAILLISGKDFLPGTTAEIILIIDILLSPLNSFITNQILIPARKENKTMKIMIYAAIVNIFLDFILIKKFGIIGAAIATIISESIVFLYGLPEVLKLVDSKIILHGLWKYILASLIIIPVTIYMRYLLSNWILQLVGTLLISIIAYIGILYGFLFLTRLGKISNED